jgi:hypothetical protein
MSTQIQRRRGTTAEHSTFTGVEGELTVDTTKDTAVVHDGTTVGGHPLQKQYPPLGSAAAPTYTFTGDPNTGIYSPGADQVAVATNGVGRLFINASGSISTSSTAWQGGAAYQLGGLQIGASAYAKALLQTGGTSRAEWFFDSADNYLQAKSGSFYIFNTTANPILFGTNATERMRITSAGLVGIGTSSPGALLDVTGSNGKMLIANGTTSNSMRLSAQNATGTGNAALVFESWNLEYGRFDTSGRLGIGTTSPGSLLEVAGKTVVGSTSSNALEVFSNADTEIGFSYATKGNIYAKIIGDITVASPLAGELAFQTATGGSLFERARIDSSGRLGIGTSAPGAAIHVTSSNAGGYGGVIYNTSSTGEGLIIRAGSTSSHNILVAQTYDGSAARFVVTAAGNVGINTTSPDDTLHLVGSTGYGLKNTDGTHTVVLRTVSGGGILKTASNHALVFGTNDTERARIDSSGRLLVGTSSARSSGALGTGLHQVESANYAVSQLFSNSSTTDGSYIGLWKSRGGTVGSTTIVQSGDTAGGIYFGGSDGTNLVTNATITSVVDGTPGGGDMPGRLVFSTTADGASSPTERMRITNTGNLRAFCDSTADAFYPISAAPPGISRWLIFGLHSATDITSGIASFGVLTNGDVKNTNNSYGALSDLKLKENIVDAAPQWNDLKALQVRNYNFKAETGQQTHTQIGLVAQEVELVSPGLVSESPDRDEDGNDLGTVTKSVNYSVLYMKAVKALQEAMERIETLEGMVAVNNITIDEQQHQLSTLAARLTALESA